MPEKNTARTATCACGQLTVSCDGEPVLVSLCHCFACQRRTGSAYSVGAFFPRDRVSVGGQAQRYTRSSDSGFTVTFHFCGDCGSTVFWEPQRRPEIIGVALGAFADPDFPPPSASIFEESKRGWTQLPDGLKHFRGTMIASG
jgi:hypothetical protein